MLAFADQFRPDISGGRGWLAIVAVVAGNWRPVRTMCAVLIFALLIPWRFTPKVWGLPFPISSS